MGTGTFVRARVYSVDKREPIPPYSREAHAQHEPLHAVPRVHWLPYVSLPTSKLTSAHAHKGKIMGMWYSSCALSGLTIKCEPVFVVFLVAAKHAPPPVYGGSNIYDWCTLATFPLRGYVDAYGIVDVCDDEALVAHALKLLEQRGVPVTPVTGVARLRGIQEEIHRDGAIRVEYSRGRKGSEFYSSRAENLGFTIVRRDVWLRLAALSPENWDGISWKELVDLWAVCYKYEPESPLPALQQNAGGIYSGIRQFLSTTPVPNSPAPITASPWPQSIHDRLTEIMQVHATMERLRMPWRPSTGLGSQHANAKDCRDFFRSMAEIAEEALWHETDT